MRQPGKTVRIGLVSIAALTLILALLTGLARLGWDVGSPPLSESHGSIFVLGFLGLVIGMERAVALAKGWAWLVPAASAVAMLSLVGGMPLASSGFLLLGGVGLVAVFAVAHRLQPELHIRVMGMGAVAWVIAGVGLLASRPRHELVPALAGFLVLTIMGERLELSRLLGLNEASIWWIRTVTVLVVAGSGLAMLDVRLGAAASGVGFLAGAVWLSRNDVAKRTIAVAGVTRYMASALLVGYVWLAISGIIWSFAGLQPGSFTYDAAVHSLFLGFIFSMVFAHAPIVVPALTRLPFPYSPALWLPLAVLHISLLLRVSGDLGGWMWARSWGGLLNVVAMALFAVVAIGTIVIASIRGRKGIRETKPPIRLEARP